MNAGEEFGRYEIRKKIGSGGMGEVYLARDKELERNVALKVLPAEFCDNEERMKRFKQEARAASALNHPNIITIYEIGETDKRAFIATEFIDGETLRDKISRHDLTIIEAVKIAEQVASALSVAHSAHIIHRDIKPENIMIRQDGYVKILDFGLAKPTSQETGAEDKTLQLVQTQAGIVMGSVRYMSPEQARGKDVDERTDIWSVGVVLYEMMTGKNPFEGETISDSLAAVLHVEPKPIDNFIENTPEELNWIVRKTLKKKADERYQNIKDLAIDLKDLHYNLEHELGTTSGRHSVGNSTQILRHNVSGENATLIHDTTSAEFQKTLNGERAFTTQSNKIGTPNWFLPVAVLGLAGMIAFGAWMFRGGKAPQRFDSLETTKLSDASTIYYPAISHDGKYMAYLNLENGRRHLAVRQVATGSSLRVADAPAIGDLQFPTFSNDGNYVYYNIIESGVGTLYQVPSLGGEPKKILVDVDSKISVSPDGKKFAFARNNAETNVMNLIVVNADGTGEEVITNSTKLNVKAIKEIAWSPTNDNLLISTVDEVYGDELVKTKILAVSLKDKSVEPFGDRTWYNANSIYWTKGGQDILLVAKASEQEAQQIWEVSYPDGNLARRITNDSNGYIMMSLASDTGTIVGMKQDIITSIWSQNSAGKDLKQLVTENKNFVGANSLTTMPDNKILVSKNNDGKSDFVVLSENGKEEKTLTEQDALNYQAAFSPDSKFIVFGSARNYIGSIWRMNPDGTNRIQITNPENNVDSKPLVMTDNKTVIFERRSAEGNKSVLMKTSIDGGEATRLFNNDAYTEMFPRLSPDGKHFAYTVMFYDRDKVKFNRYIRILSADSGNLGKLEKQIESNIGWNYKFSPDGKNLVYVNLQKGHNLYNLPTDGSEPKPLTNFTSGIIMNFAWSRDGKTLYIVRGIVNNELVILKNSTQQT